MQTTWGQCSCLTTRNSLLWSAAVTDVLCVFVGFLAQSKNTQDQVKRSVTANHRYECEFEFEKTPSPRCRAAIIHAAFRSADNRVLRIIQKSTFSFIMASRKKKTLKNQPDLCSNTAGQRKNLKLRKLSTAITAEILIFNIF